MYEVWHPTCSNYGNPAWSWENQPTERIHMNTMLLKMYMKAQELMNREEGQDLVEYALVIALVSIAAVASLTTLATKIVAVFTSIGGNLVV